MTIVIDTCVIIKWFFAEGRAGAVRLLQSGGRRLLLTPVAAIETIALNVCFD